MSERPRRHGWPGRLLIALLAGLGVLALAVGALRPLLPEGWLVYTGRWEETGARWVALAVGAVSLALSVGIARFRRWAWLALMMLAAALLARFVVGLSNPVGGSGIVLHTYGVIIVLCAPYLWSRRRDFAGDPSAPPPNGRRS